MPQREKTAPIELPNANDLPDLTPSQQAFVFGLLAGKTGTEAYREAYNASGMQPRSIWAEASRLRCDPNIASWLAAGRQACLGMGKMTLQGHLDELERIREIALASGNVGAAVAAEQSRGKAVGLYIDRVQDVTDHDPMRTIMQIAEHSPELAQSLAKQHNIPFPQINPDSQVETKH